VIPSVIALAVHLQRAPVATATPDPRDDRDRAVARPRDGVRARARLWVSDAGVERGFIGSVARVAARARPSIAAVASTIIFAGGVWD
jgi:hypothetical protein